MYRKIISCVTGLILFSPMGWGQLQLPQPSPKATISQTIGLTDISIEYSSPGVKGRAIWGELVPYDKLWRAGANAATKISFSKDVSIEGNPVPKGSYSIFMIPSMSGWTVILNKDVSASTDSYKQENDVLRIKTFPASIPKRERLAYLFSQFTEDQTNVDMEWETVKVSFTVKVDTDKQAIDNIKNATGSAWRTFANAARYHLEKKNLEQANTYADQSIALGGDWYAMWMKAQIMAEKKNYKEALSWAQKAKENGDKNPSGFFFKDQVEKAISDWKPLAEQDSKKKKK
jgi:hypothetical protein